MRLHPFTAVRDAVAYGTRAGSFGLFAGFVASGAGAAPSSVVVVLAVVTGVAGAVFGVARFLAFDYELRPSTLAITSGVVRRQSREIPLERVQNVDVQQSFLQRAFGLAVVRFETAGGGETEGELRLVGAAEAEHLQAELRGRKRAARSDRADAGGADAGEPEPTVLFELSNRKLAVLAVTSFRWGAVPLVGFGYPVADDAILRVFRVVVRDALLGGQVRLGDPRLLGVALGGVAGYLLLAWVVSAAITVLRYHGFQLARIDDELVYERGLVQRFSGTVPLEKVQTLAIEENLAMRRLGYAALTVETAGYAPGSGGGRAPSAIPLADREAVLALAGRLESVEDLAVERPPRRARRRYAGRYALVVAGVAAVFAAVHLLVVPLGALWSLPVAGLLAAVPAAHLKWANRGHRVDDDHFVARSGVLRRTTRVVPHYRLQTVLTRRSVFQRRWGLASVTGDTAAATALRSRDATAHDLDDDTAEALHATLRERLQADLRERRASGRGPGPAPMDSAGDEGGALAGNGDDGQPPGSAAGGDDGGEQADGSGTGRPGDAWSRPTDRPDDRQDDAG